MTEVISVIIAMLFGAFLTFSIIALWKIIFVIDKLENAVTYVAAEIGEISQTLEDYVYEPEEGQVPLDDTDSFEEPDLYKRDEDEDDPADNWKP